MLFARTSNDKDINQLLHHLNNNGQNLMATVVIHMDSLFAAHGILVEFEAAAHNRNPYEVQKCLRNNLGSTKEGKCTLELYKRIQNTENSKSKLTSKCQLFLKIFSRLVLLRLSTYLLDVITDLILLFDYYNEVWNQNSNNGANETSSFSLGIIHNLRRPK